MHSQHSQAAGNKPSYTPAASNVAKQAQLTVGAIDDPLEKEADDMANKVMRMPEAPLVQRKCAACEEEDKQLQRKPLPDVPFIQRNAAEASQPKATAQLTPLSSKDNGQPLDKPTKDIFEPFFGNDFSGVRVHTGEKAAVSAKGLGARAYTLGNNIVFGENQFKPGTQQGNWLLAHELAHTVQQAAAPAIYQAKLEVEPPASRSEMEADHAADALLEGRAAPPLTTVAPRVSLQRDGEPIRETRVVSGPCHGNLSLVNLLPTMPLWQPPASPLSVRQVQRISNDERRVILNSGQRYRVRRVRWTRMDTVSDATPHAAPGINQDQVWLEISWCENTRNEGRVRFGANLPQQVIQLLLNTLANGGNVGQAWQQATITPQISGDFRIGDWRITPGAQVTVDSRGQVTGGRGSLGVSTNTPAGNVEVGVNAGSDRNTGPTGGITITFRPSPPALPPCRRQVLRSGMRYECIQEVDVPAETRPGTQTTTRYERHVHNLFFQFASDLFNDPLNADGMAGIRSDLGSGFQVQQIEGYTSPEGSMEPRGWMGNDELSRKRAAAARAWVANLDICSTASCFAPNAAVTGMGERMNPVDDQGRPQDVSGTTLERHVDRNFPTDQAEAPVRSEAVKERLRHTPSTHGRVQQIYPLLRRAEITLSRSQTGSNVCNYTVPAHTADTFAGSCPNELVTAAFPANDTNP